MARATGEDAQRRPGGAIGRPGDLGLVTTFFRLDSLED